VRKPSAIPWSTLIPAASGFRKACRPRFRQVIVGGVIELIRAVRWRAPHVCLLFSLCRREFWLKARYVKTLR